MQEKRGSLKKQTKKKGEILEEFLDRTGKLLAIRE